MSELLNSAIMILGGLGWGIVFQAWIERRERRRSKEGRIIFDIPFSPEQSERVMTAIKILAENVKNQG